MSTKGTYSAVLPKLKDAGRVGQLSVSHSRPEIPLVGKDLRADLHLNGHEISALLDTGSQVSLVCADVCADFFIPIQPLDVILKVKGMGGFDIPYLGFCESELYFPEPICQTVTAPFLVLPKQEAAHPKLVVGTNVLEHLSFNSENGYPWSVLSSQLVTTDKLSSCCLVQALPLKSGSKKIIQLKTDLPTGVHALLESSSHTPAGTLVAPCIAKTEAGSCLVQIYNFSARDVVLPAGVPLATAQRVNHVIDDRSEEALSCGTSSRTLSKEEFLSMFKLNSDNQPNVVQQLQNLLYMNQDVFSCSDLDLGKTTLLKHQIHLTDDRPFKIPYRRIPHSMLDEVKQHLKDMLEVGAIKPSSSPYASPVVLVRKKDGSLRFCIDLRQLNAKTVRDAFALPRLEETMDALHGSSVFSKLDLRSGFWQVEVAKQDQAKTAFTVGPLGHFECERMPFGLTNAPSTFQRLMQLTLDDLLYKSCLVFIDDILVYSSSVTDHFIRLQAVFEKLRTAGLKLKPSKCSFLETQVNYLGHTLSEDGVYPDPDKLKVVQDWPILKSKDEVRRFLGFTGFYRRFVKSYARMAGPLHRLLREDTQFLWGEEEQRSFDCLKKAYTTTPVLAFANWDLPFVLYVDASKDGLGAVLAQRFPEGERPVAYASRTLNNAEKKYNNHKLEFLALKWAVTEKFHDYLIGNNLTIKTDNNPLVYVQTTGKLDATGQRWVAKLAHFKFTVEYLAGTANRAADSLSRISWPDELEATSGVTTADVTAFDFNCDWKTLQDEDSNIAVIKTAVVSGDALPKNVTQEQRSLWRNRKCFYVKSDVLYKKLKIQAEKYEQIVMPTSLRGDAIRYAHDHLGHVGRDKVVETLRRRFYWPNMTQQITRHLKQCLPCIQGRIAPGAVAPLVNIRSSKPMELVCMDYLTVEEPKGKIVNLLVVIDHFSKYGWVIPTRDQKAVTAARGLLNNVILQFGFMTRLHSDRGRNFESSVIKALCSLCHIDKGRTTPYHAMGNGITEKLNGTLLDILRTLPDDLKKKWKDHLPAVIHAYNSSYHQSTGTTPFELMFGRQPRLPLDIVFGLTEESQKVAYPAFVKRQKDHLQQAYRKAAEMQTKSQRRQKDQYDRKVRGSCLVEGTAVLVKNFTRSGKLEKFWQSEPYEVVRQPDDRLPVYEVRKGQGPVRTLHRNNLLPLNQVPEPGIFSEPESDSDSSEEEFFDAASQCSDISEDHNPIRRSNRSTRVPSRLQY